MHHLMQNVGNGFVFRNEKDFSGNHIEEVFGVFILGVFQNVTDVNHTDDMVFIFVAERKPRVVVLADKVHCFIITVIFINTFDVLTRYHNLMSTGFGKANCVLDDFAFGIVNNAAFLRSIDNQFDFLFRMSVVVFISGFDAHQF